jgi:hypothetical protein
VWDHGAEEANRREKALSLETKTMTAAKKPHPQSAIRNPPSEPERPEGRTTYCPQSAIPNPPSEPERPEGRTTYCPQSALRNPQSPPKPSEIVPNAQLLEAVLVDAQDAYANLLSVIESSLQAAVDEEPDRQDVFAGVIADGMSEADIRLAALREQLEPWSRRRKLYPPELAQRVDHFLDLLEKGLLGLQAHVTHRSREIREMLGEAREGLQKLNSQRAGFQGYRNKGQRSKMLDKKA